MKIGLMGGWNTDSGASFHTEQVGRSWVKSGHKVTVFSFYKDSFHGTNIIGKDEDYVKRCFTTWSAEPTRLDPRPFLTGDYDIFVAEDHGMFPNDLLGNIFHMIKRKAKTVAVVHDGKLAENPSYWQFDWDAVVSFDKRYMDFMKTGHDPMKLYEIPYPCNPLRKGNKKLKRKKLKIPMDRKIVYMFGPAAKMALDIVPGIDRAGKNFPVTLLLTLKDKPGIDKFNALKKQMKNIKIEIRHEAPDMDRLYDYLHASDVLFFGKGSAGHAVVSSTVFQCLGSGCVILARDSNYVELFGKGILRYKNQADVTKNLTEIFSESKLYEKTLVEADSYVNKNSDKVVADRMLDLFRELLRH